MPSLEVHTLNQVETELPEQLLQRVRAVGGIGYDAPPKAPEHPGAFSFDDNMTAAPECSPAVSVIGDYMPDLETTVSDLEQLHDSELIGGLMHKARVSRLTGCIMRTEVSRDHKGYSKTAIKAVRELGLGNSGRQAHRVVHFARLAEATGELPTPEALSQEVDHYCRNPACIYHTRLMDGHDNNGLRANANKVEPNIINGQMFYITDLIHDLPWLSFCLTEKDELPAKVISTRLGPYALRLASPDEFIVYGERLECEVYDSLRQLGKKPKNRRSRAASKAHKPIEGEEQLFELEVDALVG